VYRGQTTLKQLRFLVFSVLSTLWSVSENGQSIVGTTLPTLPWASVPIGTKPSQLRDASDLAREIDSGLVLFGATLSVFG
jgi:hypothetical protein